MALEQSFSARVPAVVDRIVDGLAVVLVGAEGDEWDFPLDLLPADVGPGTELELEGHGRDLRVTGVGSSHSSVEARLDRGLNRKRPIVVPLPHRSPAATPDVQPHERPSRLARGLGRR